MTDHRTTFPITTTTDPTSSVVRTRALEEAAFGSVFTDHMATARWQLERGWSEAAVRPLEPLSLHPATAVLHYAQEIFEGLKVYRHADGGSWLFRPDRNADRFAASARRLALPELPPGWFLDSLRSLVEADHAWVPDAATGRSLYLRPFLFADEPLLGVRPSRSARYGVIATPAGRYFADAGAGLTLWVSDTWTRAAVGGTGAAKCGGNYAGGLVAQQEAAAHGCDQVLYTDPVDGVPHLQEAGTMNVFLVSTDDRLLTPPLGTILDGVTRDSVLRLAGSHGLTPEERPLPLAEVLDAVRAGRLREAFATGTAATISPITRLRGHDLEVVVGDGEPGTATTALRDHLAGIQRGTEPGPGGWLVPVGPSARR